MARSLESRIGRLEQRQHQIAKAPPFVGRVVVHQGVDARDTEQRIEAARLAAGFASGANVIARVIVTPQGA
ncbi:hypothetical protein [Ferrovum sp.]|uniref:hypothetical protein n=1 Tax=Ferrovum sp. TaxID=2609467 RepID=UPI00261A2916|nr:hypothetical protein [Ferrovum sp.]